VRVEKVNDFTEPSMPMAIARAHGDPECLRRDLLHLDAGRSGLEGEEDEAGEEEGDGDEEGEGRVPAEPTDGVGGCEGADGES